MLTKGMPLDEFGRIKHGTVCMWEGEVLVPCEGKDNAAGVWNNESTIRMVDSNDIKHVFEIPEGLRTYGEAMMTVKGS